MLLRFFRFNVVGVMGIAVQMGALWLLVSGLGVHYLLATLLAVEVSLLHNFVWHERWTWKERVGEAGSQQCRMQNAECTSIQNPEGAMPKGERGTLGTERGLRGRGRFGRLVAFHAGNGLVSMLGGLVLMPLFVGGLHLHYLVANLATIAATGLLNFLLGDRVIFTTPASLAPASESPTPQRKMA